MADNLVRGVQFDGATGIKTGAQLEDLVTLASFAVGSEMLDQTTIEDNGAGKARIKALGVGTSHVAANAITDAKIRQGAALTVIGVTGNATANVADIAAGTDGYVLRRSGTALAFGQIATAAIPDEAVTAAKIKSDALSLTATPAGGGSAGYTSEGPHTTTSGAYGPFSGGVGVFAGFVNFTSAGAANIDIEYADDDAFSTNMVVIDRCNVPAAGANGFTWGFHCLIPKSKYARLRLVSGSVAYYLRYGVLEF